MLVNRFLKKNYDNVVCISVDEFGDSKEISLGDILIHYARETILNHMFNIIKLGGVKIIREYAREVIRRLK